MISTPVEQKSSEQSFTTLTSGLVTRLHNPQRLIDLSQAKAPLSNCPRLASATKFTSARNLCKQIQSLSPLKVLDDVGLGVWDVVASTR